ncbi:uncharacterized protein EHS24_005062 [Apiotrichum porosum]|uniref:Uncharacterized protein n=1 Tax=Apiotrichum porosum TaxID=105984 RepID=A0A427Y6S8_9TREE|nr:uncharacterized protein EHS24_005062 [Apiotrichum porosum]RSH86790.1 hypothetical protein EHS24_005062 [Apiotrichum porosum]
MLACLSQSSYLKAQGGTSGSQRLSDCISSNSVADGVTPATTAGQGKAWGRPDGVDKVMEASCKSPTAQPATSLQRAFLLRPGNALGRGCLVIYMTVKGTGRQGRRHPGVTAGDVVDVAEWTEYKGTHTCTRP